MVHLLLQMMGMVVAKPLGQNRAKKTAATTGQCSSYDGGSKRAARRDDSSRSRHGAHIHKYTNQPTFSTSDGFRRDVGRSRNGRIICKRADLSISVAELLLDGLLAREQAQRGAIEPRREEFIDRSLESRGAIEDAN